MRFISIMTLDRASGRPHEDSKMTERMHKLVTEMRAEGTLVDTGGRSNELLELRLTRKNGRTTVTDGPFSESKEVVGGYAVLELKDRKAAIAAATRFLETLGHDATCFLHEVYPAPE
ncbi:MAG: YciI family protein [Candidatus Cybelea sp.]